MKSDAILKINKQADKDISIFCKKNNIFNFDFLKLACSEFNDIF